MPEASTIVALSIAAAGQRVPGTVRIALQADDSEVTARRLVAAGADRVAAPVTTPWGDRNARVRVPDGMQLTLFTRVWDCPRPQPQKDMISYA